MKKVEYTIGCDPELFLVDEEGNYRSAHNVIMGSKEEPHPVKSGAIQVDGVAAEFNIEPAKTDQEFTDNICDVLVALKEIVESHKKKLSLFISPTAMFSANYFRTLPKDVKRLGCLPDETLITVPRQMHDEKHPVRSAGGHLHIGWDANSSIDDGNHLFDCREAVRQIDYILYPLSYLWDPDSQRRKNYGVQGCYRPKTYGVEYRSLSNAWVADPDLHRWVFNATVHAMDFLDADVKFHNDAYCRHVLTGCSEKGPSRAQLVMFHDYLNEEFGVPKLPEEYVK